MGVHKDANENGTTPAKTVVQNGLATTKAGVVKTGQYLIQNGDVVHEEDGIHKIYKDIKELPSFRDLNKQVQAVVAASSWWDRYGWEWVTILVVTALVPVGFWLLASESYPVILAGMFLMGCIHSTYASRCGHLATHGSLADSSLVNLYLNKLFVTFIGAFSAELAYDIHIRVHHPHTNIIGLGDSSTWKQPYLSRYLYMFVAPVLVPAMTPLVAIHRHLAAKQYRHLAECVPLILGGLGGNVAVLVLYCGYSWPTAIFMMFACRAVLAISYIHVNIFQHIGLPMFSKEHRPHRIYQMASGVLNLKRNTILDYTIGHSIISCHVEHHLFPRLSDSMCLKIKPIVSKFLKEHGLPYQEDSYWNRMWIFVDKYDELMVNAPPITHFVGIQ